MPLQKNNSEITFTIEGISNMGQGFGFNNNDKIFVPKTAPHDVIKAEIVKKTSKYTAAKLIEIITESEFRKTAPCSYFSECGGCSLQHLNEEYYRNFKQENLSKIFERESLNVTETKWIWIKDGSRRRVNFHIGKNNELGFFKENSNQLVKISNCLMLEPELSRLIPDLQNLLDDLPKEQIEQISATKFDNGVGLVVHLKKALNQKSTDNLIDFAIKFKLISISDASDNLIYQASNPQLFFYEKKLELPHNIFLQATKAGQDAINHIIDDFVAKNPIKRAVDLYSGIGTYSFNLKNLNEVICFEGARNMVKSINRNSNGSNIKALCRDLVKSPLQKEELKNFDLAIINPPRNGAKSQVEVLAKSDIKNIIMISCYPASFAQDAKILVADGYKLTSLNAIDQFYYNHHLELVAIWQKI